MSASGMASGAVWAAAGVIVAMSMTVQTVAIRRSRRWEVRIEDILAVVGINASHLSLLTYVTPPLGDWVRSCFARPKGRLERGKSACDIFRPRFQRCLLDFGRFPPLLEGRLRECEVW